jgi:hypothetical protein
MPARRIRARKSSVRGKKLFENIEIPVGFYVDPGSHFGRETKEFVEKQGGIWINSPVAAKKATGMAERAVELLQQVLERSLSVENGNSVKASHGLIVLMSSKVASPWAARSSD